MKSRIAVLFVAGSLLAAPMAHANEWGGAGKEGKGKEWKEKREKKMQEVYGQLNLTEEQKTQLKANKEKSRDAGKALFEQMKSSHEALNQELMQPELNMDKVTQIHSQLKALQTQMADNRLNSILEVRKILSHDQFVKFLSMMKERKHDKQEGQGSGEKEE
jgi:Spy/CpxP family protein refolding chaperone